MVLLAFAEAERFMVKCGIQTKTRGKTVMGSTVEAGTTGGGGGQAWSLYATPPPPSSFER